MKYAYRKKEVLTEADLKRIDEGIVDWLQGGLDVVGLVPGVGEVADGINALISLVRGNVLDAVFSVISMVPGVGDLVGKSGKYLVKLLEPALPLLKAGGGDVSKIVSKIGPGKSKKMATVIDKIQPTIAKNKESIGKVFTSLDAGDGDAVASAMGIKVPKVFKSKWNKVVKKAGPMVKEAGVDSTIDFIAEVGTDQIVRAATADEEEGFSDPDGNMFTDEQIEQAAREIKASLGESYLHNTSLMVHIYGNESVTSDIKDLAEHIRKNIGS